MFIVPTAPGAGMDDSTPDAVVAKIQRDVAAALKSPELSEFFQSNDFASGGNASSVFPQRTQRDRDKYRESRIFASFDKPLGAHSSKRARP